MDLGVQVDDPILMVLGLMLSGESVDVVDMPKTERKWYFNEDGEYVRL